MKSCLCETGFIRGPWLLVIAAVFLFTLIVIFTYQPPSPELSPYCSLKRWISCNNTCISTIKSAEITDSDLECLQDISFQQIKKVKLLKTNVSDKGLRQLKLLPKLEILKLEGKSITDAEVAEIAELPALKELDLSNTSISAAGLGLLGKLKNLEKLTLNKTSVNDFGLSGVAKLPKLKILSAKNTDITRKGVERIWQSNPYVRIHHPSVSSREDYAIILRRQEAQLDVPLAQRVDPSQVATNCRISTKISRHLGIAWGNRTLDISSWRPEANGLCRVFTEGINLRITATRAYRSKEAARRATLGGRFQCTKELQNALKSQGTLCILPSRSPTQKVGKYVGNKWVNCECP